jgi:hypothetical protein
LSSATGTRSGRVVETAAGTTPAAPQDAGEENAGRSEMESFR